MLLGTLRLFSKRVIRISFLSGILLGPNLTPSLLLSQRQAILINQDLFRFYCTTKLLKTQIRPKASRTSAYQHTLCISKKLDLVMRTSQNDRPWRTPTLGMFKRWDVNHLCFYEPRGVRSQDALLSFNREFLDPRPCRNHRC